MRLWLWDAGSLGCFPQLPPPQELGSSFERSPCYKGSSVPSKGGLAVPKKYLISTNTSKLKVPSTSTSTKERVVTSGVVILVLVLASVLLGTPVVRLVLCTLRVAFKYCTYKVLVRRLLRDLLRDLSRELSLLPKTGIPYCLGRGCPRGGGLSGAPLGEGSTLVGGRRLIRSVRRVMLAAVKQLPNDRSAALTV